MNNVEMSSGIKEHITLCLDGAQIERVKEFHAVLAEHGWEIRFTVDPEPPPPVDPS